MATARRHASMQRRHQHQCKQQQQQHRRRQSRPILGGELLARCLLLVTLVVSIAAPAAVTAKGTEDDATSGKPIGDPSLIWGTYRPQLYFGVRAALPESFLSGLLWFSPKRLESFLKSRHEASEDDTVHGYGYTYHDGRTFAIQELRDLENNYLIETSFVKVGNDCGSEGTGNRTGSWAVRVKGTVLDQSRPASLSQIYYAAHESEQGAFSPTFAPDDYFEGLPSDTDGDASAHIASGRFVTSTPANDRLTSFAMRFKDSPGVQNVPAFPSTAEQFAHEGEFSQTRSHWHYMGVRVPTNAVWKGKDIINADISTSVQKAIEAYGKGNMPSPADLLTLPDSFDLHSNFVAMQRTFSGNFSYDIFYDADETPKGQLLDGDSLSVVLENSIKAHDARISEILPMKSSRSQRFVRDLTSQIVGSLGYYHGRSIVDRSFKLDHDDIGGASGQPDPQETEPHQLLTSTPSRSKFPRGFYWDEGFHLSHIGAWDMDLAIEVLRGWFALIDENGWVEREQILGEEARSRVPAEFQAQNPSYANPPTLTALFLNDYLTRLEKEHPSAFPIDAEDVDNLQSKGCPGANCRTSSITDPVHAREVLTSIYPALRRHYLWLRTTQRGQVKEWGRRSRAPREAFRWRGRTKDHVLTSGLDDYPRAPEPHPGELHVDLISWLGAFAEAMIRVAHAIGEDDDAEEYERSYRGIVANVDDLHWNEEEQMYCDASVNDQDESFHVCHRGYMSLFPLFTGLLAPDNPHLGKVLDLLHDPKHMWTDYGLLSLSKQDKFFGQGENYWRGPIWIPINYYVLRALKLKYAAEPGPFQTQAAQIYQELRDNVVANVQKEYERTMYTWEQYNPADGHGQRSHPFTGWTSMVALIMADVY